MRLQLALFCLLSLSLISRADEITIAFWNVENLFDEFKNEATPEEEIVKSDRLREKLEKDARVILDLKADIVGLCEIENRPLLARLVRQHLAKAGYRYFELIDEATEVPNSRGIDVAIVSKRPFLAKSFPIPNFYRGILACRFMTREGPFYVLVNHWKSRARSDGSDSQKRVACAEAALRIINEEIPALEGREHAGSIPIVLVGDLNDEAKDPSIHRLESGGLVNALANVSAQERWTLPFHNFESKSVVYDAFDHVFVSKNLLDGNGLDLKPGSAKVARLPYLLRQRKIDGKEYTWVDDDIADRHVGYSDHLPVVVTLKTPE